MPHRKPALPGSPGSNERSWLLTGEQQQWLSRARAFADAIPLADIIRADSEIPSGGTFLKPHAKKVLADCHFRPVMAAWAVIMSASAWSTRSLAAGAFRL